MQAPKHAGDMLKLTKWLCTAQKINSSESSNNFPVPLIERLFSQPSSAKGVAFKIINRKPKPTNIILAQTWSQKQSHSL